MEVINMIVNRKDFIETMDKNDFNDGLVKFNIPNESNIHSTNGEGVWGWATREDKAKYKDDSFHGNITAILLNEPLNYSDRLHWADEVVLKCHGDWRPTLDPQWVMENLMS
jgi:hypothetical protein